MKRYRNATGSILAVDCTTYTRYLQPSEMAALPNSRDVRYNARLGKLVLVKEGKVLKKKPRRRRKYKKQVTELKPVKKKKVKKIQETMEINNGAES